MTSAHPFSVQHEDLTALLRGTTTVVPGSKGGIVPERLPRWAQAQHTDRMFRSMAKFPAGVALRFSTAANSVSLQLLTRTTQVEGTPTPPLPRLAVTVPGQTPDAPWEVVESLEIPPGEVTVVDDSDQFVRGLQAEPARIDIALPKRGADTPVEILLPHSCIVELVSLSASEPITPAPVDERLRWTHHGSSISHGLQVLNPEGTWPAAVALQEGWALHNLAFAGNAQLDPFVARTIRDIPADLITLKIGINLINADSMRERAMIPALHGFLDTIRERNSAPIVLISAISCPAIENSPGPSVRRDGLISPARRDIESDEGAVSLSRSRELLAEVLEVRSATDPDLFLLDGQTLLGADEAVLLTDGLHPDAPGHDLMARNFPVQLRNALQDAKDL